MRSKKCNHPTIDFCEIAMGSNEFGKIDIEGCSIDLGDRSFGHSLLFSPDSKYLLLQERLVDADRDFSGPVTALILVDCEKGTEKTVEKCIGGFIEPIQWDGTALIYLKKFYTPKGTAENYYKINMDEGTVPELTDSL